MIILNKTKFAKNDNEFTNSLFETGGTCSGYYKVRKASIELMNHKKERIAVINKNGVLGAATKLEDGKYWYSYADVKEIGRWDSYMQQVEELEKALKDNGITRY